MSSQRRGRWANLAGVMAFILVVLACATFAWFCTHAIRFGHTILVGPGLLPGRHPLGGGVFVERGSGPWLSVGTAVQAIGVETAPRAFRMLGTSPEHPFWAPSAPLFWGNNHFSCRVGVRRYYGFAILEIDDSCFRPCPLCP